MSDKKKTVIERMLRGKLFTIEFDDGHTDGRAQWSYEIDHRPVPYDVWCAAACLMGLMFGGGSPQ